MLFLGVLVFSTEETDFYHQDFHSLADTKHIHNIETYKKIEMKNNLFLIYKTSVTGPHHLSLISRGDQLGYCSTSAVKGNSVHG